MGFPEDVKTVSVMLVVFQETSRVIWKSPLHANFCAFSREGCRCALRQKSWVIETLSGVLIVGPPFTRSHAVPSTQSAAGSYTRKVESKQYPNFG